MVRYITTLIIIFLLVCTPAFSASIRLNGGPAVNAVKYRAESTWLGAMPKVRSGESWLEMVVKYYVYFVIGQSNATGFPPGCVGLWSYGNLQIFRDTLVMETLRNPDSTGLGCGFLPAFGNKFFELTTKNVILLQLGIPAKPIADFMTSWGEADGDKDDLDEALAYLDTQGYNYIFKGGIVLNSEAEIASGSITKAEYKTIQENFLDMMLNDLLPSYPSMNLYIIRVGRHYDFCSGCIWDEARAAESELCVEKNNVKLAAENNVTPDGIHYYSNGYNAIGEEAAIGMNGE